MEGFLNFSKVISATAMMIVFSSASFAAIPPGKKPAISQPRLLVGTGAVYGGVAGDGFSIVSTKHLIAKNNKAERVTFEIGDRSGAVIRGTPGYFHAELKNNPQTLVIDFAQMPSSGVDNNALKAVLRKSPMILSTQMIADPADGSLSVVMKLKPNTKARVYQLAGKNVSSSIVVDLFQ